MPGQGMAFLEKWALIPGKRCGRLREKERGFVCTCSDERRTEKKILLWEAKVTLAPRMQLDPLR